MTLAVEQHGGVPVIAVRGEVDVATAPQLRQALVEVSSSGAASAVVDLSEVEFLDSTGLGILVSGLKRFRTAGGDLHLVCPHARILKVFEITGLTKVFSMPATLDDAVAAAGGTRDA